MVKLEIKDIQVTPLQQIFHPQGDVFHVLKKSDPGFINFGEVYISKIYYGEIKSWKKHQKMSLNLIVPIGEIKFVFFDDRDGSQSKNNFQVITLSPKNYLRITVPPQIWVAFKGLSEGNNLLLNIADIEHDPSEIIRLDLDSIKFDWK